jgi:RND family efflux transporter MFP subunit
VSVGKVLALILATLLGVAGVAVLSVPGMSKPIKSLFATGNSDVLTYTVRSRPLEITVVDRGSLESSSNQDVYSNVEGQTTIIKIAAEGQRVKKDEIICELDSAALRDQLVNQRITTESAKANYQNAKLTREVAEIAVIEYVEGIYKQDLATVDGEISLAKSDLARSDDRVEWANRMFLKGYVSKAQQISEVLSLEKAKFALEQAETKKKVLVDYTKDKTIKELKSEVEKAHSDELAKEATWELEKSKEQKLERQIAGCTLKAPIDGLIVYANDPMRNFGSNQPQIEEGATVRERQKIISIPDISKMQVNTKVHESQIDKIARDMKARIRVDAFADQTLSGTVLDVAPLPDPSNFFSSDIKVYTTHVRIDDPLAGLKPGMTAQVEILADRRDNVLSVPVQAILEYGGKQHVAKRVGERFDRIDVEVGVSNEKYVQVSKGLADGDVLALNPMALMTEEEKREAFRSTSKDSKKEWGGAGVGGVPGKPGEAGAAAKGGVPGKPGEAGKGKTKAKKGGRGGGNNPMFQKFRNISPEDRARMKTASPEERTEILKKAGFTDQELEQMKNFGGGGGGGFGGGRGGRPGGGGPGGSDE